MRLWCIIVKTRGGVSGLLDQKGSSGTVGRRNMCPPQSLSVLSFSVSWKFLNLATSLNFHTIVSWGWSEWKGMKRIFHSSWHPGHFQQCAGGNQFAVILLSDISFHQQQGKFLIWVLCVGVRCVHSACFKKTLVSKLCTVSELPGWFIRMQLGGPSSGSPWLG